MIDNNTLLQEFNSPVRRITAKAELYNGSVLVDTFSYNGALKSISIERIGEDSKFFGFGVSQKANIKLIDVARELEITTANSFKLYFNDLDAFTIFHVSETHRDENTGELSITAYDALQDATTHFYSEVGLDSYSIENLAEAISEALGLSLEILGVGAEETCFSTFYENGANFEDSENFREILNDIAEATQTIYYISGDKLVFKRLDKDGAPALTIGKASYITLESGENRRLAAVCHATELGDNVSASLPHTGTTQYIRDNGLWELRDDIAALVDNALAAVGDFTINQFDCSWRGNPLLEIGDKIALETKDHTIVYSYLLDDSIEYDGSYSQRSLWKYGNSEAETASNPTTLGETLKQTYAKVDKANKRVDIVASETSENTTAIGSLQINTNSINATVQRLSEETKGALDIVEENINDIANKVELAMTSEDVTIAIETRLDNGVEKVITKTNKFTFDDTGLNISKSDSNITTQITENGMTVYKENEAVLEANKDGVKAVDLHAKTYLIIGKYSRFEDMSDETRTACFWIG